MVGRSLVVWAEAGEAARSNRPDRTRSLADIINSTSLGLLIVKLVEAEFDLVQAGGGGGGRLDGQAVDEIKDGDDTYKGEEGTEDEDGQGGLGQLGQVGNEGFQASGFGCGNGQIFEHGFMISDYLEQNTGEFGWIVADTVEFGGDGKDVCLNNSDLGAEVGVVEAQEI